MLEWPANMDAVRLFFELNRDLVFFVYGLSFFVLGLSIALQSRHASRLDIALSLPWLAAFGFTHGFHEWGEYFIPIQAAYLSPGAISLLQLLRLLLLGVSFACLFEFGVRLLEPLERGWLIRRLPAALLAVWIAAAFFYLPRAFPDPALWQNLADALARYFIGFPGGLIAAYGLRQHTYKRIARLKAPHITRSLRAAGVMLALYGVFGGLLTHPIPFFPGNVINTASFESLLIVPPQVLRSLVGLALTITTIRALEVFDLEIARRIETMEQQQILAAERERIARSLHDGAMQKVYTAGLIVESAAQRVEADAETSSRLARVLGVLDDAIHDLRSSLRDLQSDPTSASLRERIERLAEEARFQTRVDLELDPDGLEAETFSPHQIEHLMAILNEAVSNVLRHADAKKITITARRADGRLAVSVADDGIGLSADYQPGYGLRNMRDRVRLLNGEFSIESSKGEGTLIRVSIPRAEAD